MFELRTSNRRKAANLEIRLGPKFAVRLLQFRNQLRTSRKYLEKKNGRQTEEKGSGAGLKGQLGGK
jgi:hypothetical protein